MHKAAMRPGASQDVAIGASSTKATNAISATVTHVRLVTTTACYVAFGTTSVVAAKPGGFRLAPNWPEVFLVAPGQFVAVIEDTATGTLTITEMAG